MNNMDDTQIIKNMYQGEARRDASSKVRGFFFQDLLAIDELLSKETDYVCIEYIEDVFVVSGNTARIIQAKYYPNSTVKMEEIVKELYYQFVRMELYGYGGKIIPILAMHGTKIPVKPTFEKLQSKDYINVARAEKPFEIPNLDDWLKKNVYSLKKEDAQRMCFQTFAWNGSMQKFLDEMLIINDYGTLAEYRKKIAEKLVGIPFDGCIISEELRQEILLGLAIQCVQKKYNETSDELDRFSSKQLEYSDFISYLEKCICIETEESIGAYLSMVTMECWDRIEKNNTQLTQEKIDILQCIRDNTANWLFELGSTAQGQLKLLNTVSTREINMFENFTKKSWSERHRLVYEHRDSIGTFLRYLWKILLYVNRDLIGKNFGGNEIDIKRLHPKEYFDVNENRYLKTKFLKEESNAVVILDSLNFSYPEESLNNIFARMQKIKPEKWYMSGAYRGRYDYSMDVSEITDGKNISSLSPDTFRIECMKCVKIDREKWNKEDDCENTIFADQCIKESGGKR